MAKCRSCDAEIIWSRTTNDKAIPLDPEQVYGGNIVLEAEVSRRNRTGAGETAPVLRTRCVRSDLNDQFRAYQARDRGATTTVSGTGGIP